MKNTDRQQLAEMLTSAYELHGKQLGPAGIMLWCKILEPYGLEDITNAVSQLLQTSTYLPKPSEVVDILAPSQWPTPAEAWATYPVDERDTGAVCDETQAAWASAEAIYQGGDHIGARRAFEGAYQRHADEAKRKGQRKPRWRLSIGWDAQRREQGARAALQQGLISPKQAERYLTDETQGNPLLPSPDQENRRGQLRAIGRILGGTAGGGAERSIPEGTSGVEGGPAAEELGPE